MTKKIDHFITRPQPTEEALPFHDVARLRELGPSTKLMNSSLVPEADMRLTVLEVKQVPPDYKSGLESHKHQWSEIYGLIGDLTVEFMLEGETRKVTGPAALFIPSGMMHTFRPLRGSGYVVAVCRSGEYEASGGT